MPTRTPTDDEIRRTVENTPSRAAAARILRISHVELLARLGETETRGRPRRAISDEEIRAAIEREGSAAAAARALGVPRETIRDRLKPAPVKGIEEKRRAAKKKH